MGEKQIPSNKAKIARRVIEVLDFFDDAHPVATVMDIARRYDRPQSSTSELLASLVGLGILRSDPVTRTFSPTPRAALIGSTGQSDFVRDGTMVRLMDRLVPTGASVALIAKVGLDAQIIGWRPHANASIYARNIASGVKEPMFRSSAGWMLLSTLDHKRCEGFVRRSNAEASDHLKFSHPEMMQQIAECRAN